MSKVTPSTEIINRRSNPGKKFAAKSDVDFIKYISYALVLVLFIGFAGIFVAVGQIMIDSLNDKRDSTYQLQLKIDEQTDKIESLTESLKRELSK